MISEFVQLMDSVVDAYAALALQVPAIVTRVDFPDRQLEDLDKLYIDVYPGERRTQRTARGELTRWLTVLVALRQAQIASADDLLRVVEELEEAIFDFAPPLGYGLVGTGEADRDTYDYATLHELNMFSAPLTLTFLRVLDDE